MLGQASLPYALHFILVGNIWKKIHVGGPELRELVVGDVIRYRFIM